jgi:hypothetical protein
MKSALALIALFVVMVAGIGVYYWQSTRGSQAPPPVVAAPPSPTAPEPPRIAFPVPESPTRAPLPALAESDSTINEALAATLGRDAAARYFYPDGLVRRFVATIDNLPRKTTAIRLMPVKPIPGPYLVTTTDDTMQADTDNALRYRPYLLAMEAVEAKRLVAVYVQFYPLFQAAYQELGYPNGYFNDRLVQAIDDLLATPVVAVPPRLVQPKVMYQFADTDLEERSAGQKILLRMGTANAARVKDKLRAIRRELTGRLSPP